MAEQRTSLHVVIFLGLAALGIVSVLMMVSLEGLERSSAGTRAKLVNAVLAEYKWETAFAEFQDGNGFHVLRLSYATRQMKASDTWEDEMRDVAQFLYAESLNYEDQELIDTRRIDVQRTQVSGTGCFRSTHKASFSLELPKRLPKIKDKDGKPKGE